jgi:hypothetical protein
MGHTPAPPFCFRGPNYNEGQSMAITVAEVESAISAIQSGGQSVTIGEMSYSAANLSALIQLRDQIKRETDRTGGGRPTFRGFNFSNAGYSDSRESE